MSLYIIIIVTPNKILSRNSDDFARKHGPMNRTDQSSLNDIDPDLNYLGTDIRPLNTQYFDDQTFRETFKS